MGDRDRNIATDTLRILHGARSLPPAEAVEKLKPFLDRMRSGQGNTLADSSIAAVTKLAQNLQEKHAASDDLWQEAIEATLSYVNEMG
jgi:hypothetical protein